MTKTQKIIAIILGALAIAAVAATVIIYITTKKPEAPTTGLPPRLDCPMENGTVTGQTGKTALELLQAICETATTTDTAGITTVTSINDITVAAPDYWAFYVNDTYALEDPATYQTAESETIKWQLETLGN